MKAVVTVIGKDQKGIIAKISNILFENGVNILDISQTIVSGWFNMMMVVDLSTSCHNFEDIVKKLNDLGEEIGVQIKLQRQDIFDDMHRI